MKREPSIHVTESELAKALDKLGIAHPNKTARKIAVEVKGKACNARTISITSDRIEKKVKSIVASSKSDAMLLNKIIYNLRKARKHRGIKLFKEGTGDWTQLKNVTKTINEFCSDFGLNKREGYIIYFKLVEQKVSSYSRILTKMDSMSESISQDYEAQQEIMQDDNKNMTSKIHDQYCSRVFAKTGMNIDYKKEPSKYIYFLRIRERCTTLGVSVNDYIKSQFSGFEYRDGVPDPIQMVGEKADKRLSRYLYENNIKVGSKQNNSTRQEALERLKKLRLEVDGED